MTINVITRKIKYTTDNDSLKNILTWQKYYNNVLKFTYNRVHENPQITTKELIQLHHGLKNIPYTNHLFNSAIYEARQIQKRNGENKVIFGGKKLFFDRMKGLVNKEEYNLRKLLPINSIGEAFQKGNRFFQIINDEQILFKPNRNTKIILQLTKQSKKSKQELLQLIQLQQERKIPITFKLDKEFVYFIFDYNYLRSNIKINKHKVKDRIFAIDQNPNYLGWSVVDWENETNYKIIDSGVYSLKELNDKYFSIKSSSQDLRKIKLNDKRRYETTKIAQELVKLANHYGCKIFSIEDLSIKSKDSGFGKKFNRLCNNCWNRQIMFQQIEKYCKLYQIKLQKVICSYTSFTGNLIYRNEQLPDMVLASIEIGRRAFEFNHQYILKDKLQQKNIVLPNLELVKQKICQSLEELHIDCQFENWMELYSVMKKSKQKYRLLLEELNPSRVSSIKYKKKYLTLYSFV